MSHESVNRRRFNKLSVAAFGGLVAGTGSVGRADDDDAPEIHVDPALLLEDPHVCRGLNACEGKGAGENNACGGRGNCATVEAHSCAGQNDCKGQGGCGGYPGQNTCDGKGHCAVPLKEETWTIARKQFEHLMDDAGLEYGDAPEARR